MINDGDDLFVHSLWSVDVGKSIECVAYTMQKQPTPSMNGQQQQQQQQEQQPLHQQQQQQHYVYRWLRGWANSMNNT